MHETLHEKCNRIALDFSEAFEVGAVVFDAVDREKSLPFATFCTRCANARCRAQASYEYGVREAFRWQGKYIYYCPAGLTFVAASIADENGILMGGITFGPLLMGDCLDALLALDLPETSFKAIDLPDFSPVRVKSMCDILYRCVAPLGAEIDNNISKAYTCYSAQVADMQAQDISKKIRAYLLENYSEKITLDDVAAHVYLSRAYVSQLFKQSTGDGIFETLSRVRVQKAQALLRETALSLSEIALVCGFEDQSYFSRVFKKALGVSPKKYREQ